MKKDDISLSAELDGKVIYLTIEHDPTYLSPADQTVDKNTKRAIKKGKVSFYNILISVNDNFNQYYLPSQIFASDEKILMRELSELINEEDFLKRINK
ncbi:MAG: hypothetical protein H6622_15635 [Halobacteriovoraceae bacterium]|nr:hypothetical protein [Halobacteriovoraceae bacterium]